MGRGRAAGLAGVARRVPPLEVDLAAHFCRLILVRSEVVDVPELPCLSQGLKALWDRIGWLTSCHSSGVRDLLPQLFPRQLEG